MELDAPRAFARWLEAHRAAAADVLEHGTWLDSDDIDALLGLPVPGIDELVGLIEIERLAGARGVSRAYDAVIVDTAPTGHALRLLSAPDTVRAVADLLDALQEEHRVIRERFARIGRAEASDRLIDEIARQARDVAARLRRNDLTRFHWVTLPEPLSIAETKDALEALANRRISVPELIVNRVLTDEGPCPICDRRRAEQRRAIVDIRRTLGKGRRVTLVPALAREPVGLRALASLARDMADGRWRLADGFRLPRAAISHPLFAIGRDPSQRGVDIASLDAIRETKLIFVGGKGGVGKTTVAAAIALSFAAANRRVLLISTDPAHSVRDVFRGRLPKRPRVVELDAAAAFAARAKEFESALETLDGGVPDLIKLAPPGIDELFGMLTVFEARGDYDRIVVDTAPTGHALRLLETPDIAREWVQLLMRVLLKYREVAHAGDLASELVALSKGIRELHAMLGDAQSTRFLVVTRAARLPREETVRLLASLRRLRLATPAVIVNALTTAPGTCRRCRQTATDEAVELRALRRAAGRRVIIRTPLAAPAPAGVAALDAWRGTWIADG